MTNFSGSDGVMWVWIAAAFAAGVLVGVMLMGLCCANGMNRGPDE